MNPAGPESLRKKCFKEGIKVCFSVHLTALVVSSLDIGVVRCMAVTWKLWVPR
jgi:hypothetical protein